MAIIKYTLVNSTTPSYITDGGYYYKSSDDTYIGIGSGGGTEISKAELVARYQSLGGSWHEPKAPTPLNDRAMTDAELETAVNNWCSARGIS